MKKEARLFYRDSLIQQRKAQFEEKYDGHNRHGGLVSPKVYKNRYIRRSWARMTRAITRRENDMIENSRVSQDFMSGD